MSLRAEPSMLPVLLRKIQTIVRDRARIDVYQGDHIIVMPSKDMEDVSQATSHIALLKDPRWSDVLKTKSTPNQIYIDFAQWWIVDKEDYAFLASMNAPYVKVSQLREF